MSLVKKCDICGDTYDAYNEEKNNKKPNGFMYISLDMDQRYFTYDPKDCCPICMVRIKNFIDSLAERGMLMNKILISINNDEIANLLLGGEITIDFNTSHINDIKTIIIKKDDHIWKADCDEVH